MMKKTAPLSRGSFIIVIVSDQLFVICVYLTGNVSCVQNFVSLVASV